MAKRTKGGKRSSSSHWKPQVKEDGQKGPSALEQ